MSNKTNKTAKVIPITDAVVARAEDIKAKLGVDGDAITSSIDNLYESTLTGDLTIEQVRRVQEDRAEFVAAVVLASGEVSEQAMLDNKDLKELTFETAIGHDSMFASHKREGDVFTSYSGYNAADIGENIKNVNTHLTNHFAKAISK